MKKFFALSLLVSVLSYSPVSFAQTEIDPAEITSSVPELSEFHEIIYPMWHEAYPSKDWEALKGFVPQIKASVESINEVKLPGILRERENEWKKQLEELNIAAQNYYDAVNKNDNEALLKAAENLHSTYEKMVRIIRPVLKEIDDFHQTLYIIYHKLYPDGKYDEIAGLTDALITKAEAIMNYPKNRLKQRLGDNTDKFDIAAKGLYNATISLKEALNGVDPDKKNEAIESMHKAYQELEAVFH
jgi:CRISPR/Cas system CSM-associated protein Csm2 small subunit